VRLYRKSEKDRSYEFRRERSERIAALINNAQRTSDDLAFCTERRERDGEEGKRGAIVWEREEGREGEDRDDGRLRLITQRFQPKKDSVLS
jgi:hypothetical protein